MKLLTAGYLLAVGVTSALSETIHGLVIFTRHGDSKFQWARSEKVVLIERLRNVEILQRVSDDKVGSNPGSLCRFILPG